MKKYTRRGASNAERLAFYSCLGSGGCHLWTGAKRPDGYCQLRIGGKYGKSVLAHRLSWEVHRGPVPDDLCVLHSCDIRSCVNPEHLFLGTHQDNCDDKWAKGRQVILRGEAHGMARLNERDVRAIRASAEPHRVIAENFGVGTSTIGMIKNLTNWAHLSVLSK